MEIQKIYSEIDTEERLYSVLLSEDELTFFSEILDEHKDELAAATLGGGLLVGGSALSNKKPRIALRKYLRKLGKRKYIKSYNEALEGGGAKVIDITFPPGSKEYKNILSKAKNTEKVINKGSKGLKYIGGALVLGSAAKALNSKSGKGDKD